MAYMKLLCRAAGFCISTALQYLIAFFTVLMLCNQVFRRVVEACSDKH
jgi:hypothetical protein